MPEITTRYTITRDGTNVILLFDNSQKSVVWRASTVLIQQSSLSNLITFGNDSYAFNIDWQLCDNPVASSVQEFVKKISRITRDSTERRTISNESIATPITPIVQLDFANVVNPRLINTSITGSGTIGITNSMITLQTGVTTGEALAESIRFIKYRPGRGVELRFTSLYTTGITGTQQLVGAFNERDGFAIGFNGVSFGLMHRNNFNEDWYYQNEWNFDKADGSGILPVLDKEKINLFQIDFLWYGAGIIKYSMYDPISGSSELLHTIEYTNANIVPNLNNPSLNLSYYITNGSSNSNLKIQSAVISGSIQGPTLVLGFSNSFANSVIGISTTLVNIFTLRSKNIFGVNDNKVETLFKRISMSSDGNGLPTIFVYKNATITSPTYNDIETGSSVIEADIVGTAPTGGRLVYVFTLGKTASFAENIENLDIRLEPGSTLTFSAQTASNTSTVSITTSWVEDL